MRRLWSRCCCSFPVSSLGTRLGCFRTIWPTTAADPRSPTVIAVVGATLNLGATLYAVPIWGIAGAAAASSITYGLVLAATAVAFWLGGRGSDGASTDASTPPTIIGDLDAAAIFPDDALA